MDPGCYLCWFSLSKAEIAHSSKIYAYVPAEEAVELVAQLLSPVMWLTVA